MSIEKMKLINIIGPVEEFENLVLKFIVNEEIHVENVFDALKSVKGLKPFSGTNLYGELIKTATEALEAAGVNPDQLPETEYTLNFEEAKDYWTTFEEKVSEINAEIAQNEEKIKQQEVLLKQLEPIRSVNISMKELFSFKNIKVRFGKLPWESYEKMVSYLKNYDIYFLKFSSDSDYVYGAYFAPAQLKEKTDGIFSSLYFERTKINEAFDGTPAEQIESTDKLIEQLQLKNKQLRAMQADYIHDNIKNISDAYLSVKYHYEANEVFKLSGHTKDFFYVAGWVPQSRLQEFKNKIDADKRVTSLDEDPEQVKSLVPPTKLKNPAIIKPFQGFIEMYGLPAYNEVDPTPLFAITYTLMFGMMYGDMGHGLVLALIGLIMASKKNFLGPILTVCGCAACVFGAIFSSVFGYEYGSFSWLWKPLWEPMKNMMPTLIATVVLGVIILSVAMVINIINGVKQHDKAKIFFDANGVAGFVFYWAVILAVLSVLHFLPSIVNIWYIALFVAVPLLLMFVKEPLAKLLSKRKDWKPESVGGYILETFFEMFETLLSFITNTVSFIRVGAFALNHAGMMSVVFTLARMGSGSNNLAVVIIGNIIVLGLEGLLVAIQVLRLQFYEMFSRYYSGTGKPFKTI